MQTPLVIAHRGDSSRALENSLHAFRLALSVPVDMIEFDLRMSRDAALYVMHDRQTGRTADRDIDIERATAADISGIRLANGEPVPSLDDVLALLDGKTGINIEIKSDGAGPALAARLARFSGSGRVVVSSFREAEIDSLRATLPRLACSVIYDTFSIPHIADYRSKGYDLISLRKNTVTEPLVRACRARGIRVFVWTVDEEEEMKRCIDWQVDGIYTNKPALLSGLIRKS